VDKLEYIAQLGRKTVAAVGNGRNDRLMLQAAGLGIAVIGPECAAAEALAAADIVAPNILAALDLLLNPLRLVATLRS
jgi:soluble P-type ATPase